MARKKPETSAAKPIIRRKAPKSVRISPKADAALAELSSSYDIGLASAFEAGVLLLLDALKHASPQTATDLVKNRQNPKQDT